MNMIVFAESTAQKCKALLGKHDNIIFSHGSTGYKVDNALKTIDFDPSGLTAMVELKHTFELICSQSYIKINAFNSNLDQVMQFSTELHEIQSLIANSQVMEWMHQMSESIKDYFAKAGQTISLEMSKLLDQPTSVVDIYVKALKSGKDFDTLVFSKGIKATEYRNLELFSTVYQWRDFNSLEANIRHFKDGIYFCFVDKVFGFVLKNGEQLTVVADHLEYNSARKFLSNRFIPYQKHSVDAGRYLPYALIEHQHGRNSLKIYTKNETIPFENQTTPSILCELKDLPVKSLVYVVLMFEMLVKKLGENPGELDAQPVYKHGTAYILNNAIEHKLQKTLITVDDVWHDTYHKCFEEPSYKGINIRMEELFSKQVDNRLLNLVKHHDQVFYPDDSGRFVPFNEVIEYECGEICSKQKLKLHAFDMTMIGTHEQLEEFRFNVARHNYAQMIDMHGKIYMHKHLPQIRTYLEKAFYSNIENIESIMGYLKIETSDQSWSFMTSKVYNPNGCTFLQKRWLRIHINKSKQHSSVKTCYRTGAKRYQNILFRIQTVEELSVLLGIPFDQLPEPLKIYSWVSRNHNNLNDHVDALLDIWEQRLIEFEVDVGKGHYNSLIKLRSPEMLNQLDAVVI